MKMSLQTGTRKIAIILLVFILTMSGGLFSLEPPTKQQLAKYRLDGTLAHRIADAKALGNHSVNPGLIQKFKVKLERLRLKALGMFDDEIDSVLPTLPPGDFPGLRNKGNNKVFALLIDFPDYPSNNSATSINGKIFGNGAGDDYPYDSLRNYYRRSSYNQLELQGSTLGWYRPAYTRANVPQTSEGRENLIKEALTYFDGRGHDFSQYDNDNDGVIDYFLVIWAGPTGEWASFWWGYYTGWDSPFILDGKQFRNASYSWQEESSSPGTFYPFTIIHETGHALGLPDLYDYDDTVGPKGGVGRLDVMDGNLGDHNGFSKMLLDWLTPKVCNYGIQTLTLKPTGSYPDAVIFWPNFDIASPFTEFFMVQNRRRSNNDFYLPSDGLLIWHIDARLDSSTGRFLYNNSYTSHKLVRLMEADGREDIERSWWGADAGDFYVAGNKFNKNTTPNSNAYNGSATDAWLGTITSSGSNMTCKFSFGGNTLRIAVNNASLGTTKPAPGTYVYSIGAEVHISAIPSTYSIFFNWSGSATGSTQPLSLTMDSDKSITANFRFIYAPIATGRKVLNRTFSQAEYINILSWEANPANAGLEINRYRIYLMSNGTPSLLAEVGADQNQYSHRKAGQGKLDYAIVAVHSSGREGAPALVSVQ